MSLTPPPPLNSGSFAANVAGFPAQLSPYPNVQPFSYPDGLTFQKLFEAYRSWLLTELVPHIDTQGDSIIDGYNAASAALAQAMVDYSEEISADRSAFEQEVTARLTEMGVKLGDAEAAKTAAETARDAAQQWAAGTQALQDNAVSTLVGDAVSQTSLALRAKFDTGPNANNLIISNEWI